MQLKKIAKRRTTAVDIVRNGSADVRLRIFMTIAMAGAIANTIGFLANLFLTGINFPTVACGVCALLVILNLLFGLRSPYHDLLGVLMMILLVGFEFPMLAFAYGPVQYPYMIIGFLSVVMLTSDKSRKVLCTLLCVYDIAIVVLSTLFPTLLGDNGSGTDLLGSAVVTFLVALFTIWVTVAVYRSVFQSETLGKDSVTGVLSREGLADSVKKILENEEDEPFALLYFDFKSFKAVNAVYGLEGGNRVLKQFAERLVKSSALKPLCVARVSGDHFVALLYAKNTNPDRVNDVCHFKYSENGKEMSLQLICGIYNITDRTMTVQSMCDRAHAALRFVHNTESSHCAFYSEKAEEDFLKETALLGEIEQAIAGRVFEPFYQPIVDCQTGKIVSAEALARWIHPERGPISPGVFIPILEKKELITELDDIIASKVNRFYEKRIYENKRIVPVSVNLSRVDLYDSKLIDHLQFMVRESRLSSEHYRFEVTESTYESLSGSVTEALNAFRRMGAKILVDDFGSGFSSLGMITDCEFDVIKLDMSFAARIEENDKVRGVIRSLIEMSHNLGAKVVAEGVETEKQHLFLKECGCDFIQGYYFYKPMREAEFCELLDKTE